MATSQRKVYETSFRLSASMSKDYQETFEMARRLAGSLGESFVDANREAERAAQVQTNAFEMAAAAAAQAGLTQILGELKDAYISVTEASMEFGYQMSAVEAISQANGSEMQKLTAEARELGETTVFTATESAEAMTFMAQAGWNTQEMLAGMSGVISLAAASGTGLAESSSIVADTLAGFGMQADETGRLVDVMAQAAAHSNTNVSLMGQTFQNAAAVAGALGFTIEDTSVMLGLMANAGVKGSRAGTTLRNIFNGLAKGVQVGRLGEIPVRNRRRAARVLLADDHAGKIPQCGRTCRASRVQRSPCDSQCDGRAVSRAIRRHQQRDRGRGENGKSTAGQFAG